MTTDIPKDDECGREHGSIHFDLPYALRQVGYIKLWRAVSSNSDVVSNHEKIRFPKF